MTRLKLAPFAGDEGALVDPSDGEWLRTKKLAGVTVLDFTGITRVTPSFLSALFQGMSPAQIAELALENLAPEVDAALIRWLERASDPAPTPKPAKPAPIELPKGPRPVFATSEAPQARYTPTRLMHRLRTQLTRYLEAAYPLNDTRLIQSRRALLDTHENGRLLAQEPFVETTARYTGYHGDFRSLPIAPATANFLYGLSQPDGDSKGLLFPDLYEHQARSVGSFLGESRRNLIIATGTGSGKTECFLIPMIGTLFEEAHTRPEGFDQRGVRALILYPMNALVNDQLARLRLLLGNERFAARFRESTGAKRHPVFGMYTGRTPYAGPRDTKKDTDRIAPLLEYYRDLDPVLAGELKRMGRFPAKDLAAFLAEDEVGTATYKTGKKKGQAHVDHNWRKRLMTSSGDRELLTRHEMIRDAKTGDGAAPDVLITNYSMLEYMLMRPFERPLFEQTRQWLREPGSRFTLVLDEAHMYRGAKGAEVAFLIRRLMARLGVNDRPDKVSVICTSASLGDRDDARQNAARFAADLTGAPESSFEVITGQRARPANPAPGTPVTADALAAVDLDALHGATSPDALRAALAPVYAHFEQVPPVGEESAVLTALYHLLEHQPFVHQLLALTSVRALALGELADKVFPGAANGRRATEVLLTLGAIARTDPEAPGLLPTRVHMMFRGLNGLYACLNETCSGRQCDPGEKAPLGKLFVDARTRCDACGSRVFEVASCRECGAAYVLAYSAKSDLSGWRFLWGETAEHGTCVQLLPGEPRADQLCEVVSVQLRTGVIVEPNHGLPLSEVRDLWIAQKDGERVAEFSACPVCQPASSQREGKIRDLRTRGEQPFTALIETQFAEQPPQKRRDDLPNQGRKVLVFSDGRQKAARLAPALSVSHAQDTFRQVLVLAVRMLNEHGEAAGLGTLYPAVLKVCSDRSVDLFPDADETEWRRHLELSRQNGVAQLLQLHRHRIITPAASFAKALFSEATERFLSLSQLAIGAIDLHPILDGIVFKDFPAVGLDAGQSRVLLRHWLRVMLERRCLLLAGASRYNLGEQFLRPDGLKTRKRDELISKRFLRHLETVLGAAGAAKVCAWLESVADRGLFLSEDGLHYLSHDALIVRLHTDDPWLRCERCNRLYSDALGAPTLVCDECGAGLLDATGDQDFLSSRVGYYRDAVLRALQGTSLEPFGLTVEEHTAQLTGMEGDDAFNRTERYELRFQDLRVDDAPPIDVLSCTTTMEVGIDIGTLCGVALRNVPPHVANYQQRAGRAGRRGRAIASVLTYAHGGSHDAWYYDNPARIISGEVRAPVVYIENQKVLERHIRAYVVQVFFHETASPDSKNFALFEAMGTVESFLDPAQPCSVAKLSAWLQTHGERMRAELRGWVPRVSHAEGRDIDTRATIEGTLDGLIGALQSAVPVADFARRESLEDAARTALEMSLSENLLQALVRKAVFPRYAFPTDTVGFWVQKAKNSGTPKHRQEFDYQPQRDLQIALSEYAPGRSLTIDRLRFTSAALYNPYQPDVSETLRAQRLYASCSTCGFVRIGPTVAKLAACPVCGNSKLFRRPFVTPEGFAPDANAKREPDRGGAISWAGQSTPAKIEVTSPDQWDESRFDGRLRMLAAPRDLVVVNKGIGDRGFMICPRCGLAEGPMGPGVTRTKLTGKGAANSHQHPTNPGFPCAGTAVGPLYLGHQFRTDVLLMRIKLNAPMQCPVTETPRGSSAAGRATLTSLVEAITLAASRALQIDEGELAGNWNPVPNGNPYEADLYLYDLLPGGAGYTHQVHAHLNEVFGETRRMLTVCSCTSSCYRCLRHYGNQMVHGQLDRTMALALLDAVTTNAVPSLDPARAERALEPLRELLRLRGITHASEVVQTEEGELKVPLRVDAPGGRTWVEVHHPLVDPEALGSRVLSEAMGHLEMGVALDTYTLENDLPTALERVLGAS